MVCVVWATALWAPVSLHHRGNTTLVVLEELPMLIGLVFLSPPLLVLACVSADAFVFSVLRKQAPVKVSFNVASAGFGARRRSGGHLSRDSGRHTAPSAFVAGRQQAQLCASAAITALNLRLVTMLNGQTAERRTGSQLTTEAMLVAANVCLAIVVLDAVWFDLWATVPLLLVAVLIIAAYRGYTRLTSRFSSLQRLYDFSRALGMASLEPSSMSLDVLRQVCTVMRARRAELILAEPSGIPRRITLDGHGPSGIEPINLEESSIVTKAIETGVASLHKSAAEHHRKVNYDSIAGQYSAAIVAPLMNQNTAIGAIVALDRDEELDSFDDDDLRLFETLVAHSSASLERARLVEELRYEVDSKSHQATHDMLTGLPNRMLFLSRAATALNESQGVAIVLLDLDRFKDVNDTLGHAIGDRLLCEVSERLLRAVPEHATVARLGGDEFALVIANVTKPEKAITIINNLNTRTVPTHRDGRIDTRRDCQRRTRSRPRSTVTTWPCCFSGRTSPCTSPRSGGARSRCTRWNMTRACAGGSCSAAC